MLSRPLHAVRRVRAALLVGLVLAGPAASADGPSTAKVGKKIDQRAVAGLVNRMMDQAQAA